MNVDKFGRFSGFDSKSSKNVQYTGGLTRTPSGDYDIDRKLLRNVKPPILDSDAATKGYVLKYIIPKTSPDGGYNFNGQLLENVKNPNKLSDAATLSFVKSYSLHTDVSNSYYDAENKNIRNISDPTLPKDAATMEYVNNKTIPSTSEGDYSFGNKLLRNIKEPKQHDDAATRGFVEKLAIKRTKTDDDYDMGGKRIRNVNTPLEDSDVVTKKYIMGIIPEQHESHWGFSNKKLSNIRNPVYDGEAVNLATLHSLTLCRLTTDEKFYNANNMIITNVGNCEKDEDATNKRYVTNTVQRCNKDIELQLHRLGRALFTYIHRASGRSAEQDVNQHNYLDWDHIIHGENKESA